MELTSPAGRSACQRSWLIALCMTAVLVVATSAAAGSASGSTSATRAVEVVHDGDVAVPNPVEPDAVVREMSTMLRIVAPPYGEVPRLSISSKRIQVGAQSPQNAGPRDSLRNGAVIGAVIGAVAFGAFAAVLCHAYQEEGGASCVPDTLRFAAIGGAVGLGAGLAVDLARSHRRVVVRYAIGF